jgi:hypothetical protein
VGHEKRLRPGRINDSPAGTMPRVSAAG